MFLYAKKARPKAVYLTLFSINDIIFETYIKHYRRICDVIFIGIFGIDRKSKVILSGQNFVCPSCDAFGRYDVIKSYSYFYVFFIPLWRWDKEYSIKTYCCSQLCSLDYGIGLRIEKGEHVKIQAQHIRCRSHSAESRFCPRCSLEIEKDFYYCPYCGGKL